MEIHQERSNLQESNSAAVKRGGKGLRWARIQPLFLHRRPVIIGAAMVSMALIELVEHFLIGMYGEIVHVGFIVFLVLGVIPFLSWMMINVLETTQKERDKVEQDFSLRFQFSQKLGEASNWEELISQIVRYPHDVIPKAKATLYVFNPHTMRMEPESACGRDGKVIIKPVIDINPDSLPLGSLPQLLLQNGQGSTPARNVPTFQPARGPILPPHRYDLPIMRNDQQVGVLKLEFPLGELATASETRLLKSAAPVMALALEGAILQTLAIEQAAASEAQRQQVAQNLHDTLAQNIGYLRLKLDQLTGENAIREIGVVLQELERMRATADEAYQQVRSTLEELNPIPADDLVTMLVKQAQTISQRATFELRISQIGSAYNIIPARRQHLLYIAREALHNIEKHACAQHVQLQFLWLETELIIKITDDGIGFDPRKISTDGHYGLWIMQHRAQEIGGTLKIAPSEEGHGTEVTLWIPRSGLKSNNISTN